MAGTISPKAQTGNVRILNLTPDSIVVGIRLRGISESNVTIIAESFSQTRQIQPVTVTLRDGLYHLITGAHRLSAARRLGWTEISAMVLEDVSDDDIRIIEIDENLARAELSPAEIAIHQAERKSIYEHQHPGSVHGTNQHTRTSHGDNSSYVKSAAKTQSKSPPTVYREAARGKALAEELPDIIGTSLDHHGQLDNLAKLKKADPDSAQALVKAAMEGKTVNARAALKKAERREKEQVQAKKITTEAQRLGETKYGVIYTDPPWDFKTFSEDGKDRSAENHYAVQSLDDLRDMEIPAAKDCVLLLWSTTPMLAEAISLIQHWGFEYKSCLYWNKVNIGTGYWVRDQVEPLLIATRGNPIAPAMGTQLSSLFTEKKGKHSAKPDAIRDWISRTWPETPKLEMYSRTPAVGWDVWGAESLSGKLP